MPESNNIQRTCEILLIEFSKRPKKKFTQTTIYKMVTMLKNDAGMTIQKDTSREIFVTTHDGLFHADDVFSVALLRLLYKKISVKRTRDKVFLKKVVNNPNIFVLDVGGQYEPQLRNFDHHQKNAPQDKSTVVLLFEFLFPDYRSDDCLSLVFRDLITAVSNHDLGICHETNKIGLQYLPTIISGFNRYNAENQDGQFMKAVDFAYQIIGNEMHRACELIKSEKIWSRKRILNQNTVLLDDYCILWRTIQGDNPEFPYIVQPDNDKWLVLSADSNRYPLPKVTVNKENLVFAHKNRFITIFDNYQSALNYINNNKNFQR